MRERGHGRTTNDPACTGWMQFQIIVNYYYFSKAVSYLPYIHVQVHGAHDGKSKSIIEVNISFKLISPWQNSGSRIILSTKLVGAQSVFELDASSDNGSEIKENGTR